MTTKPEPAKRSIRNASFGPATEDTERLCPHCEGQLPLAAGAGAQAICHCSQCKRPVRPVLQTPAKKAFRFRDTLRMLVRLDAVPERVIEEVLGGLERELWTRLTGIDGEPFKTFEDFCSDPQGLGVDPGPVKDLLVRLKGRRAVALLTTPVSQQGRRTDRASATSRRRGEKSRTPRNDTRLRKMAASPPEIKAAFAEDLLGLMAAERLAVYAQKCPDCPDLARVLLDLANQREESSRDASLKRKFSVQIKQLGAARVALQSDDHGEQLDAKAATAVQAKLVSEVGRGATLERLPGRAEGPPEEVLDHSATRTSANLKMAVAEPAVELRSKTGRSGPIPPNGATAAAAEPARCLGECQATEPDVMLAQIEQFLCCWRSIVQHGGANVPPTFWLRVLSEAASGKMVHAADVHANLSLQRHIFELAGALCSSFSEYPALSAMALGTEALDADVITEARAEAARRLASLPKIGSAVAEDRRIAVPTPD